MQTTSKHNKQNMKEAIFFDFDGVIADSFELYYDMCSKLGKEHDAPILSRQSFKDLFNGNFYDRLLKRYPHLNNDKTFFKEMARLLIINSSKPKIISEVVEEIKSLSSRYDLFIITSNTSQSVKKTLSKNRLSKLFKEVLGADKESSKKKKITLTIDKHGYDKDNVFFITDTLGDIKESNELGVRCIAVTWGFHPRSTLSKGKPYKIISKPRQLSTLFLKD